MELFLNYYLILQIPWNFFSITNVFATILKELKNRRIYCFLIMFLQLPFAAVAVLIPVCTKKLLQRILYLEKVLRDGIFFSSWTNVSYIFYFHFHVSPLFVHTSRNQIFFVIFEGFFSSYTLITRGNNISSGSQYFKIVNKNVSIYTLGLNL